MVVGVRQEWRARRRDSVVSVDVTVEVLRGVELAAPGSEMAVSMVGDSLEGYEYRSLMNDFFNG